MAESRNDGTASILPLAAAAVAVWLLLSGGGVQPPGPEPGPGPEPVVIDPLSECHQRDRASKVRILREMASREFANDPEQAKWHNEQIDAARKDDFRPYVDAVAEAIVSGTLEALADKLEGKP